MTTINSNDKIIAADLQRITAMQKYVTDPSTQIALVGKVLHPADVIALFQKNIDQRDLVLAKRAELKNAIEARRAGDAERHLADEGLKAYILARFGAASTELAAFGYAPRKKGVKTVATKGKAILLNKATRKARGTLGPKAKLAIKGTLPVVHEPTPTPTPVVITGTQPPAAVVPAVSAGGANGASHA